MLVGFNLEIIYKSFIRVHGEVGSKIKKKPKFCFQIIMKDCHFFKACSKHDHEDER
jgi:hypothetical protein